MNEHNYTEAVTKNSPNKPHHGGSPMRALLDDLTIQTGCLQDVIDHLSTRLEPIRLQGASMQADPLSEKPSEQSGLEEELYRYFRNIQSMRLQIEKIIDELRL